ncbi:MAG: glycerate kinase [Firmicutes bacterium]|nr:glycerate kinase [Bacillota bacterium]
MKIVIAPDKFKGTLSAPAVARAAEAGVKQAFPDAEIVAVPMADGGEGTVDAMLAARGGNRYGVVVTGPLGDSVKAEFGILADGTAVVEMAQASGLNLVPEGKRDPTVTTTFGTGEIIEAALDLGARTFIIGIGGSATCDGGIGVAQALGIKIRRRGGGEVGFGGGELIKIESIDITGIDPRVKTAKFLVASDVDNPLYGPNGAAHVFAPQKGATAEQVIELDQGLIHLARIIKDDLGIDVSNLAGGGAAGGLGAGLVAFLGAAIRPGAELIIDAVGLREKIEGADLVITGEGQIDVQSIHGKTPISVARLASELSVRVLAIAGRLGDGYQKVFEFGVTELVSLSQIAGSDDLAMKNPVFYIEKAVSETVKKLLR